MARLRQDYAQFKARNTEIIAVGPEDQKTFSAWWHQHKMPFIGIADPEHMIANNYGQQVKIVKLGRLPASMLIDKQGFIRYKYYGSSMSDIAENQLVLSLIDEINKEES